MMKYKHLQFRRQYLLTTGTCEAFIEWRHELLGQFHVYVHPDLELSVAVKDGNGSKIALIGYMIDPRQPDRTNNEILTDILHSVESVNDVAEYLYAIGGRFVLAVTTPSDTFIFHDPCGLRTVYYAHDGGAIHIGSQPLVFEPVMPLKIGERLVSYQKSAYSHNQIEHWIPSGCSLYENIHHLVPNHFLRVSDLSQTRYWPTRRLTEKPPDEVAGKAADLLTKLIEAGSRRFRLALPLTAGRDSRLLLSASKKIAREIFFYTLQYRKLNSRSADIRIPRALLTALGYTHEVIDCRGEIDTDFGELYENNTSIVHKEDWGRTAFGMLHTYPSDRVCLKGNCSEVCRCFYYKSGKHRPIKSEKELIALEPGWSEFPFIKNQLSEWFSRAQLAANTTGVDILDLFYWEHRMGSWQAQSQLEWDLIQEAYTPFNHRQLLEMLLCAAPKFRCAPDYSLYRKIGEIMWPDVMKYPINPPETLKHTAKHILFRVGLESTARTVHRRVRGLTKSLYSAINGEPGKQ